MTLDHNKILKMGRYSELSIKGVDTGIVRNLYKFMLRLRRCEEALIKEYHPANEMQCPVHFCVGQESVPAALSLLIQPDDYLLSHHRTHGYFLARGAPMNTLFAEMYGRETGANGGVAGSQDISVPNMNFCSGAILTGAVSIAVGVGLGFQLHQTKNIAFTGFGEGAADEGIFWEGINYAALHQLPVIFLCENNRYATYSPQAKRMFQENLSERVAAFGLQTRTIFGNDVMAVRSTLLEAIEETRNGRGPFFIEAFTYRFKGHVGPEDDDYIGYRPKEELEFWKQNCPISLLEERMVESGLLTASDKENLLDEIDKEIAMAFEFAKKSPFTKNADWQKLNYSQKSPMADKLLKDGELKDFNQNQADTIPGPY